MIRNSSFLIPDSWFRTAHNQESRIKNHECLLPLGRQKRLGIGPLPQLLLKLATLVDEDLSIVGQDDTCPLERARRRTLEVDPARPEAAAVAGALELVFRREIVRRAAQVGAGTDQRVKPAHVLDDVLR